MSEEKYTADQVASAINAVISAKNYVVIDEFGESYSTEFIKHVVSYLDGSFDE